MDKTEPKTEKQDVKEDAKEMRGEMEKDARQDIKDHIILPEDFQKHVHQVLQMADTKHKAAHMRDRAQEKVNEHEDKERQDKMKKNGKGKMMEFSKADMPMD